MNKPEILTPEHQESDVSKDELLSQKQQEIFTLKTQLAKATKTIENLEDYQSLFEYASKTIQIMKDQIKLFEDTLKIYIGKGE